MIGYFDEPEPVSQCFNHPSVSLSDENYPGVRERLAISPDILVSAQIYLLHVADKHHLKLSIISSQAKRFFQWPTNIHRVRDKLATNQSDGGLKHVERWQRIYHKKNKKHTWGRSPIFISLFLVFNISIWIPQGWGQIHVNHGLGQRWEHGPRGVDGQMAWSSNDSYIWSLICYHGNRQCDCPTDCTCKDGGAASAHP